MTSKTSRPLFLFYLLCVYVMLQFAWWGYMILNLNNQLYLEKLSNAGYTTFEQDQIQSLIQKKKVMVTGEAFVFFTLLLAGMYMVRRSLLKEDQVMRQQKNFLLSVTHELKSPLASVRLQTETLKKHQLSKEKQEQVLVNTLQDIDRLNQLVENILLVTRIDKTGFPVNPEIVNLSEYISECLRNFRSNYPGISISNEINDGIYGSVDPLLFRSVIINLLENAYKYGSGNIAISLEEKNDKVILAISDQGPGIPAAEKEQIFQIFYRIGNEETRKARGTGLGLYIVKSLIERHDGTITIKDNKPAGSVFEIKLPKKHV